MITVFHHTPVKTVLFFKQFDGLNFDGLNFEGSAGKHQNVKISPCQNFVLYGTLFIKSIPPIQQSTMTCFKFPKGYFHHHRQAHLIYPFNQGQNPLLMHMNQCRIQVKFR